MNLEELVQPTPVSTFLTETWGKQVQHLVGPPDRFTPLISWQTLETLLTEHRFPRPRLRLSRQGEMVPPERYSKGPSNPDGTFTLLPEQFYKELRGGAMLVLDSVDQLLEPVRDLAESLESTLHEQVKINAYAGWSPVEGFDLHWDDHDVIVLQISGVKEWQVHGPARRWPMQKDIEQNLEPPSKLPDIIQVSPGDVLHVPRGHWHRVRALKTPSLHLTIGVTQATGYDFLAWLLEDMLKIDLFRQDLPFRLPAENREEYVKQLRSLLKNDISVDSMQRFIAVRDATVTPRARISLRGAMHETSSTLLPSAVVHWAAPRFVLKDLGGAVQLSANGKIWTFKDPASAILRHLTTATFATLQEISAALPEQVEPDIVASFVLELCRIGLATVEP